jgi:magnesium chelatase family protein
MASMARERGLLRFIVPEANAREAAVVTGVQAFPVRSLPHMVELLNGKKSRIPLEVNPDQLLKKRSVYDVDFQDIRGQYQARRAMEIRRCGRA